MPQMTVGISADCGSAPLGAVGERPALLLAGILAPARVAVRREAATGLGRDRAEALHLGRLLRVAPPAGEGLPENTLPKKAPS